MTVDGLVAKAAADAVPLEPFAPRTTSVPQPLASSPPFSAPPPVSPPPAALDQPPEFPPFSTTTAKALSGMTSVPPPFESELPPKPDDGYSVSALQTIMAGTLSAPPPPADVPNIDPDAFERDAFQRELDRTDGEAQPGDLDYVPKREGFLEQARRAAKAAAAEAEQRAQAKKPSRAVAGLGDEGKGRNLGRLAILAIAGLAVIAGIVALLFTIPGGGEEINRPDPTSSLGEILNTPPSGGGGDSPAEFAPPSGAEGGTPSAAVAVEPNGLGVAQPTPVETPRSTRAQSPPTPP